MEEQPKLSDLVPLLSVTTIEKLEAIVRENYQVHDDRLGFPTADNDEWDVEYQPIQRLLDVLKGLAEVNECSKDITMTYCDPVTGTSEPGTLRVYDVVNKSHLLTYRRIDDHANPCCVVAAPCVLHSKLAKAHQEKLRRSA